MEFAVESCKMAKNGALETEIPTFSPHFFAAVSPQNG